MQDNKLKVGFIKEYSFSNELDAILGSRLNFIFHGLGKEFEFNNLKLSSGLIHQDASLFVHFTKPKNNLLKKIRSNFFVKVLPGLNIFGEAKYLKNEDNNDEYNIGLGYHIELTKKSEIKCKLTNEKKFYCVYKSKINENLDLNIMGNIALKEKDSKETYGKILSSIGFNITYTDAA